MAHPLNRPVFDKKLERVTKGYAILQPTVAVSLPGTNKSKYARLFGSEPGIDPYTRTISDVYQDMFHEGSFIGKGIYDVDSFIRVLKPGCICIHYHAFSLINPVNHSKSPEDVSVYKVEPYVVAADDPREHRVEISI